MKRLWVRLSLAFAAIVVISFGAISLAAQRYFSDANVRSMVASQLTRPDGLRDQLAAFHNSHGSWQGVETLMQGADATLFLDASRRITLLLADEEGRVLYATGGEEQPDRLNASQLQQALPIVSAGSTAGFLDVVAVERTARSSFPRSSTDEMPPGSVEEMSGLLIQVLLIAGGLAIIFGMLVSRWLSAPLTHLVAGTQAIASRDLSFRVDEQGSTEMREVATSFNEMAVALEGAETLRSNLLTDVAHELRTPLTVLEGNLRAILDDVYPLEKAEIARLYDQTRQLHRLVNDLRLLAQAEARQLPLQRGPCDLAALLAETAEFFAPLSGEKEISLQTELPPSPVLAAADRLRLGQALQNLLTNALQHTPPAGLISLSLHVEGETAAIAVADNGKGIAAEDIGSIFDRFYRVDEARSRDTGGVGLGLAIAQALIEAHDGTIDVTSAGLGKGSTFTIRLPLRQADASSQNTLPPPSKT